MPTETLAPPTSYNIRRPWASPALLASYLFLPAAAALLAGGALAGPVLCTTTLEAPPLPAGASDPQSYGLVEVTRCGVTQTVPEVMTRRFYGWSSPFARAVDVTHQITDLLGIAMGGGDGTKVMGFGYLDQTLIWDGSAMTNTAGALMEEQFVPIPIRTSDLPSAYGASIGEGQAVEADLLAPQPPMSWPEPVRGMW